MPITNHMAKNLPRYLKQVDAYLEVREAQGLGVPFAGACRGQQFVEINPAESLDLFKAGLD